MTERPEAALTAGAAFERKREAGRFLLVALLFHLAIYLPSLPNQLVYDDTYFVTRHPVVTGAAPLLSAFARPYFDGEKRNTLSYRPLAPMSMGLSVRLYGPSPALLRLENIVWAALGAALFASLLFGLSGKRDVAWIGLALLTCHPIRSEAVITIVGRAELVGFCLSATAILFAIGALERASNFWAAASAIAFLAAILVKENGVVTPALLLVSVLFAPALAKLRTRLRDRPGPMLPLAALWGLALVLALFPRRFVLGGVLRGPDGIVDPLFNALLALPEAARPGAALALLTPFFERLAWPSTLCGDYALWAFPRPWLTSGTAALTGALLLALTLAAGALSMKRLPLVSLGVAWLLAAYLPFANILFVHGTIFAERLLTVPVAGFVVAVAAVAGTAREGGGSRPRLVALVLAIACLLGIARTWRRIPDLRSDETFYAAVARDYPGNARAHWALGMAALSRRDRETALPELSRALAGYPDFDGLALDSAIAAMRRGDPETSLTVVLASRQSGIALDGPAAAVTNALERDLDLAAQRTQSTQRP